MLRCRIEDDEWGHGGPGKKSDLGIIEGGWDMSKKIWHICFAVEDNSGDGGGGGKNAKEKKAVGG